MSWAQVYPTSWPARCGHVWLLPELGIPPWSSTCCPDDFPLLSQGGGAVPVTTGTSEGSQSLSSLPRDTGPMDLLVCVSGGGVAHWRCVNPSRPEPDQDQPHPGEAQLVPPVSLSIPVAWM